MKILKKIIGIIFIILGFVALVTPFTPGAWLLPIGLGILGIRIAFWEELKRRYWNKDGKNDKTPQE